MVKTRDKLQRVSKQWAVVALLLMAMKNVFAESLDPEQMKALLEETRALRTEVAQLKRELAEHRSEHKSEKIKKKPSSKKVISKNKTSKKPPLKKSQASESASPNKDSKPAANPSNFRTLGGYIPLIAPYLGHEPAYDGSDLLTNLSQQGTDLLALQFREELENAFSKQKLSEYYLILSGTLDAQLGLYSPFFGRGNSDIDLTVANITALAGIGKWVTGFFSFDYNSLAPNDLTPPQIGPRVANSRIYLDQGFMTIGNLKKFDGYASIGQMYLPFGQYNSYTINSPLTASLFTTSERPIVLGYSHSSGATELDVAGYFYHGETSNSSRSSAINEWGINVDYIISQANWNGQLTFGYISNVADSEGMQLNGQLSQLCSLFGGFAFYCNRGTVLQHRVPGIDLYGSLTLGNYSFIAEYLTATRSFSPVTLAGVWLTLLQAAQLKPRISNIPTCL
jgi:Sec-independent protein translocase protein TatA